MTFGQQVEFYQVNYLGPLTSALAATPPNYYPGATTALHNALQDDRITDLFSAFSSTEDFVTAYELHVLKHANQNNSSMQLTSLSVQLYDNNGMPAYANPDDILGKLGDGKDLHDRATCFNY